MKLGRILIVAFALLLMATPTFAAASFTSASTLNLMAPNARTGLAGNVTLTVVAPGPTQTIPVNEVLIDSFQGAQISTLATVCVKIAAEGTIGGPQTIVGFGSTAACTAQGVAAPNIINGVGGVVTYGVTYTATAQFAPAIVKVVFNTTNITISNFSDNAVPPAVPTGGPLYFQVATDEIEFTGVRLNVVPVTAGTALGGQINATLTSVLSQISTTNPNLPVASIVDPITLTASIPMASFSTGAIPLVTTNNLTVAEAGSFSNAFETEGATTTVDSTQLNFTWANLPTGVTVFSGVVAGGTSATVTATCGLPTNNATAHTAALTCYIQAQSPAALEQIVVTVTYAAAGSVSAVGQIGTATVTLGPEVIPGTLLVGPNITLTGSGLAFGPAVGPVRYFPNNEPPVNVVTVVQLITQLLSVFNVVTQGTGGFDTGISVHNGSGYLGIAGQNDVVTVTFLPFDGSTPVSKTTNATFPSAANRGFGLDANGAIKAGGSWVTLMSGLLADAGITGEFRGAVRFTCFFTNGHGINYVYNLTGGQVASAQGYEMLVLNNNNVSGVETRPFILESVGQ